MIFLDNNSTTATLEEVRDVVFMHSADPLNASSTHSYGRRARKLLEEARETIAKILSAPLGRDGYKIIFTSGGTESNNLVINNFADSVVLYSSIEHASISKAAKNLNNHFELKVNKEGIVELEYLEQMLEQYSSSNRRVLVSVMLANNETGVIQNIVEISKLAHAYNALVHSDIVQAFGKIQLNIKELDLDYATISSHKIGGLVGTGALLLKDYLNVRPVFWGGGQERGERSGTENILGALCFAKAAEISCSKIGEYAAHTSKIRKYIEAEIQNTGAGFIISENSERLPNTSLIASRTLSSDLQLMQFDEENIAISNGSACSSGKVKHSHVLKALGYSEDVASKVIRVSLSLKNTIEEAQKFIYIWKKIHKIQQSADNI